MKRKQIIKLKGMLYLLLMNFEVKSYAFETFKQEINIKINQKKTDF